MVAVEQAPDWVELAQAYRDRLAEEFPRTALRASGNGETVAFEAALVAGVATRRDGLQPRHYLGDIDGFQTKVLRDNTEPAGGVELGILLPSSGRLSFGAHGSLQLPADRVSASEAYGVVVLGKVGLWGGRRRVGFGSADAGSVVLSSDQPFDGAGLFLADGVRLPGFLGHIGVFRAETTIARLDRAGEVETPWFFGLRTSVSPHPRFRIGVNRAAVFGGEHELVPSMTFGRIVKTVVGLDNDEVGRANFEDQIASLDLWFAPMLGSVPVVIYGEWGVGDLAAQKTEMPAIVGGLEVPGFPGAPWLNLGFEGSSFKVSDQVQRSWYDHRVFGTWTDDGKLRGHALGGAGNEFRIYAGADLVDARLSIEGRGFTRDRKEGNLFAPTREGSSKGMGWSIRWRIAPSLDVETSGIVESGTGWTESGLFLGTRFTL